MCGIAGFNFKDPRLMTAMTDVLAHRGPDDEGTYVDDAVSLGHRRLSILDVSPRGRQPMTFQNLVITYNGEVYNFRQLRTELEGRGYTFVSNSDTEVVLYSYHLWGPPCVEKFNGMWAFCVYDKDRRTFFLSRDRFGIKPLYYYFDGERFVFASELKAIRCVERSLSVDAAAVNWFFYQKYIGGNRTIFERCYKLRPAENLVFDLEGKRITTTRYFDLRARVAAAAGEGVNERLEQVDGLICDAVESRLVADVPVGSFLSGGVDSSLVSAVIARNHRDFKTFSIGFNEPSYDEVPYSERVSRHIATDHHVEYLDIDEAFIEQVISRMDEPFGDASVLPTYLLSKMTRKHVTVSLSGDGADEVFGGYDTYQAWNVSRFLPAATIKLARPLVGLLPPDDRKLSLSFKMKKFVDGFGSDVGRRHLDWMGTFNDAERRLLLRDRFIEAASLIATEPGGGLLSIQLNDVDNYLAEDILKKVDLASMLNSLEVRVPYLDYRLVPIVLSLPTRYKIRHLRTKWLLKAIAGRYLPADIVHRKKRGFTVPIARWIRESALIRHYLTDRRCFEHGLLDYDTVAGLLAAHLQKKADHARPLWLVFVFNYWHDAVKGHDVVCASK